MGILKKLLSKKFVNTNGYKRSNGTDVHAYLRTHPKNQGVIKRISRIFIQSIKK